MLQLDLWHDIKVTQIQNSWSICLFAAVTPCNTKVQRQSYQKSYFVPEPGYHCAHCPPSIHWISRLLTSANPGEEGESTPFVPIPGTPFSALRHIHISPSPLHPWGLCWSAASKKKTFLLFVHNMPSFPPCYLNWRGLQTSKRQSPFQLYTTLHPWKSSRETLL